MVPPEACRIRLVASSVATRPISSDSSAVNPMARENRVAALLASATSADHVTPTRIGSTVLLPVMVAPFPQRNGGTLSGGGLNLEFVNQPLSARKAHA